MTQPLASTRFHHALEIANVYRNVYRNPCIPHDPLRCAELVSELHSEPGRVLDVGCGEGHYLASFVERGWSAVGVEPNAKHAAVARGKGIDVEEVILTEGLATTLWTFDAVILSPCARASRPSRRNASDDPWVVAPRRCLFLRGAQRFQPSSEHCRPSL